MGASVVMLRLQAASLAFVSVVVLMTILAQSTGQVVYALMLSLSRQGAVFVVVLLLLSRLAGNTGVIATPFVADTVTAVLASVIYVKGLRPMLQRLE